MYDLTNTDERGNRIASFSFKNMQVRVVIQDGEPWFAAHDVAVALEYWGCKPEPPKFPSSQLQPRHESIQVNRLAVALEGVMPVEQDVPPSRR